MDGDPVTLMALLLDPCLTVEEAVREAAATPRPSRPAEEPRREGWRDRPETLA
jgi:hypothetical protein